MSKILLNSLINEGANMFLQPVQRRIQRTHEYRQISSDEMRWVNNQLLFTRHS